MRNDKVEEGRHYIKLFQREDPHYDDAFGEKFADLLDIGQEEEKPKKAIKPRRVDSGRERFELDDIEGDAIFYIVLFIGTVLSFAGIKVILKLSKLLFEL